MDLAPKQEEKKGDKISETGAGNYLEIPGLCVASPPVGSPASRLGSPLPSRAARKGGGWWRRRGRAAGRVHVDLVGPWEQCGALLLFGRCGVWFNFTVETRKWK
jgi:hypothetical protein